MLQAINLEAGTSTTVAPAAPPPAAAPAPPGPALTPAPTPSYQPSGTGSASAALQGYTTSGPATAGEVGSLNVPASEGTAGSGGGSGTGSGTSAESPDESLVASTFQAEAKGKKPPGIVAQWRNLIDVFKTTGPNQRAQVSAVGDSLKGVFK